MRLSVRDRLALVGRALAGSFPTDPNTVGGRLLSGVISPGGTPPARGTRDFLESYSTMPWLRAVASRISYDIAAVQWKLTVERQLIDGQRRAVRNRQLQRAGGAQRQKMIRKAMRAGEVEEILSHPSLDLLHNANAIQTGLQMRKVTMLHIDLAGDGFWLIERDALGTPIAVWPLPPNWVLGTPTPRRPMYRVGFRGWQGMIPETEIIWFQDSDPLNPYGRGTSPAMALGDELETDEYVAKHTKQFFYNRARPDLIIYPKGGGNLHEDQVDRLEEAWTAQSQGFWKAFRPFFLKREVEIKQLDQNFRSMQLIQLREFERNTIMQVYGVSPETLGIIGTGSNRATITMSDAIYARRVLMPRLEMLRTVMQERLMPLFDERIIIDYESPVVRDSELELEAGKAAPFAPTINEWRERMGYDPIEGAAGEMHMVGAGQSPVNLDAAAAAASLIDDPTEDPADDDLNDAIDPPAEQEAAQAFADGWICALAEDDDAVKTFKLALSAQEDPDDPAATRLAERQVPAYRRAQERAWRQLSAAADEAGLVNGLIRNDDEQVITALGGINAFSRALTETFAGFGRAGFIRGAALALETLPTLAQRSATYEVGCGCGINCECQDGKRQQCSAECQRCTPDCDCQQRLAGTAKAPIAISLQDMNPEAAAWALRESGALIRNIGPDTRAAIRELIAAAHARGLNPREIARRIRDLVGLLPHQVAAVARFEARLIEMGIPADVAAARAVRYAAAQRRYRAVTIARTETIASVNHGQQALWQMAKMRGILSNKTQRVWIATHDDRLDAKICEPLDGTTAGLDEPFAGGLMVPPAHPRCRCAVGLQKV